MELADGSYRVEVTLKGGTGRTQVASPAPMAVREGTPYAVITWDSSHYDYMEVAGEGYTPTLSEDGASFEIPVTAFDTAIPVQAETTAMSTPHMISYTLEFHSDSIRADAAQPPLWGAAAAVAAIVLAGAVIAAAVKRHA